MWDSENTELIAHHKINKTLTTQKWFEKLFSDITKVLSALGSAI